MACELFGKSRQAYYKQKNAFLQKRDLSSRVIALIEPIRIKMPRIGVRKLYYLLQSELESFGVGRDKLFRIMKANHLLIQPLKSYRTTTNSYHRFHKHKDLVGTLNIHRPEQVWVADITYIGTRDQHRYLSLITDAYSKKIMGYDLSESLSVDGAKQAFEMALKNRSYQDILIHHSDRGIQYCCDVYQKLLQNNKVKVSMTEKYDPYANAIAERVNGILKQEFLLETYHCELKYLKKIVKESIDIYNQLRPHLSCKMLTPEQMHQQSVLSKPNYSKKQKQRKLEVVFAV